MADDNDEDNPMVLNESIDMFASDDRLEPSVRGSESRCAQEEVYRHVLGEFSMKNYGLRMQHWVVPNHTLHAPSCMSNIPPCDPPLNASFPFRVYRPLPFLPPANVNPTEYPKGDPLLELVEEKEAWEKELHSLVQDAKKGKKWAAKQHPALYVGKIKKKDKSKPIYSVFSCVSLAKHLEKDPCPSFSGDENWLASGGCVTHCQLGSFRTALLLPTGKEMDTLRVISLEESEKGWSVEKSVKPVDIRLFHNQRIYQVVAAGRLKKGYAVVRQTKGCSVVHIKFVATRQSLLVKSILEIQDNTGIFTSIDIESYSDHQFCTLDGDHFLKIWDINTSTCISTDYIAPENEQSDNWGCVQFSNNPNEIVYANRQTIHVKDIRVPLHESALKYTPSRIINDCEQLTLLFRSSQSALMYAATSHNLLSLDPRSGWQQRWTHMLQASPLYGAVQKSGQQDVVMLGSCGLDDSVVLINTHENSQPLSLTLPVTLPSLGDCLLWARVQGQCLSPGLTERLEMSAAGITVMPCTKDNSLVCVKVTSIGDVFFHRLTNEPSTGSIIRPYHSKEQNDKDLASWKEWERAQKDICLKRKPTLPHDIQVKTELLEAIKTPLENNEDLRKRVWDWHKTFPRRKMEKQPYEICDWNETLCNLSAYKDLMAEVLLEAWDSDSLLRIPDSKDYVRRWLGTLPSSSNDKQDDLDNTAASFAGNESNSSLRLDSVGFQATGVGSSSQTLNDSVFKTPKPVPRQAAKKIKRESMGF